MKFNFFLKTLIVGISIVIFASCDRDFNELGSGILGDEHYGMDVSNYGVNAYNQLLGPVQTNNLPVNQFGYYNNSVFGKTKASFVSQLGLAVANPTFYDPTNVVVDSVYLYVPYYSTFVSTDDNSDSTYELDSIHGTDKIKVGVYESTTVLESLDASTGFQQIQKYYSDKQIDYNTSYGANGGRLNNDNKSVYDHTITNDKSQNDEFVFDKRQIKIYKKNADGTPGFTDVSERKAPGMLLNLDTAFFKDKIVNAPAGKLYNNNVFKNYFRGLYFKVDASSASANQGSLAMMNFGNGVVTMIYHDKTSATDATVIRKTLSLNISGNTVNLLDNENIFPGYTTPNPITGDSNLYLKGGDGSMAIIDLFNGEKNSDNLTLNTMRTDKWLINEASITFHVNTTLLGTTAPEPNRIFLYDLKNKRPLVDYYIDATTRASTKYNKFVHDGLLRKADGNIVVQSSDERGTTYKIKITNHIRNLVNFKDSTNVRLGLVVTEGITQISNFYLKSPYTTSVSGANSIETKFMPVASFINPLGTILYGSNSSVPDDKRIKLQIYYTKPD
ncbi:DUF4270 domain-containing protein [Flavobacterium sp. SUN052]|uniref:DUF4270 domain-containing protein n=1 Tax=Flavobacterium sp. SUN052 TaxID=3002441 RepID=UPI00237D9FD0|nr:DUF4270 domain-containing protein [Flavobacterium sp. SUN052]MEC4003324.1 DUF4270 domain-containing protein [Flavobacterium sp. SUN052]